MAVVYGRRRVGKSSLIQKAYRDRAIYNFEGLENRATSEQIFSFKQQLSEQLPDAPPIEGDNWYQVLRTLARCVEKRAGVVVLDEFQWMANYPHELVSVLMLVWDQHLSKCSQLTLVLCGSVASFMVNRVIRSRALYGRVHQAVHLKPFKLDETRELLAAKSVDETIQAQMLVGGVPGYLNRLQTKSSVFLGIQELAFSEHGYFTGEFDRIFVSQFGRSELYRTIIRVLASHPAGLRRRQLSEIKEIKNGGNLSAHLKDLELAGLISAYYSFQHGPRAKVRLYRLTDPYLRLYLHFIEPNLPRVEAGHPGLCVRLTGSPAFAAWQGLACEILCYEHRQSVIQDVEKKIEHLPNPRGKTVQRALIVKRPPETSVVQRAYFSHVVLLRSLANSPRRPEVFAAHEQCCRGARAKNPLSSWEQVARFGMSEFRVSSGVRYAADFSRERRLTVDGQTVGPWHLDDGTGAVAADATGRGNDATIASGNWEPCD